MKIRLLAVLCAWACPVLSGEKDFPQPYKDDSKVIAKLKGVGARTGLMLGKFKVMPADAGKYHSTLKNGPGVRNFCNKMVYAPDRGAAMYCGANHGVPHLLNDVWEYHLGSNTWHMICPPGNDYRVFRKLQERAKKDAAFREKEFSKRARKWWETCEVKDGYLGAKKNGGPVFPRHTWDGVTYDERTKQLYWAVLDGPFLKSKTKWYAKYTGRDEAKLLAQLKPGSTMYIYDDTKKRWRLQQNEGPAPVMRGMGGTLVYLPDVRKTIWYVSATNRVPQDHAMWSYDAKTNKWERLMSSSKVRSLAMKAKPQQAPRSEVQAAYSMKHKKIVAVQAKGTYIYDVTANTWKRGADTPGYGHDAHSVFAYDSNADAFLLYSKAHWRRKGKWNVYAYDLAKDKWETVKVQGKAPPDDTKTGWRGYGYAGYYDPGHNALVLYQEGIAPGIYVYRHAAKKEPFR